MGDKVLLDINGWPTWRAADGRLWPLIAGGSAGPGAGDDGGGDDGGQGGGQGGTSGTPAGTAGAAGTAAGEPDDDDAGQQWPEDAKKLIRKVRKQAQDAERREREARQALETRATEGMTEAERAIAQSRELQAQLAKAQDQLRLQSMREAFRAAGTANKAKDPDAIWMLIDRDAVEWGPDGEVLNATELVRDLRRNRAWAFQERQGAQGSADAAQGSGQTPAQVGSRSDENDAFNRWFRGAAGRT
jgi:hypothetical protein